MEEKVNFIKNKVKNFDDIQRLRIQAGGRIKRRATDIHLNEKDKEFFAKQEEMMKLLEKHALKGVKEELKGHIMEDWLLGIKGISTTSAGVLLGEFDIEKADTVSKFWSFAGLSVVDGKAPKPKKGEKLKYNSWLRAKLIGVIADNFIKQQNSYSELYYNYKHRKQSAGWGASDGHRHNASKRYMIKMFLMDFYLEWRKREGLPIRPSYQEEYLGHVHHES